MKRFWIGFVSILFLFWIDAKAETLAYLTYREHIGWQIRICETTQRCQTIPTRLEPWSFDYDPVTRSLLYTSGDGKVRAVENGKERIAIASDRDAFTQPRFLNNSKEAIVVRLLEKNSKKTKIEKFSLKKPAHREILVSQSSTALDPWIDRTGRLFFANVSCANGCGRIIQEIWLRDLSGMTSQITLENRLAHQPSFDSDTERLYYSAKTSDGYTIYRIDLAKRECRGQAVSPKKGAIDTWPSPDGRGGVYFLRSLEGRTVLLHIDANGSVEEVPLPPSDKKIRNIKVYP